MNNRTLIAGLVAAYILTACANGQDQSEEHAADDNELSADELQIDSLPETVRDVSGKSKPVGGEESPGSGLQRLVELAKQDLAATLAVEVSVIETVSAQYVTWRDSAMGCPEPGYEYLQVLTSGTRIRLSVSGQTFDYHGGDNQSPFLCRNPDPLGPLPHGSGET